MARSVPPPYAHRHLLVCTNARDPSTGKPSCGMNGGLRLREQLKVAVKERGLKGKVKVTGTGCLDYCPASGCVVAFYPENEWAITDTDAPAADALLARLVDGLPGG